MKRQMCYCGDEFSCYEYEGSCVGTICQCQLYIVVILKTRSHCHRLICLHHVFCEKTEVFRQLDEENIYISLDNGQRNSVSATGAPVADIRSKFIHTPCTIVHTYTYYGIQFI